MAATESNGPRRGARAAQVLTAGRAALDRTPVIGPPAIRLGRRLLGRRGPISVDWADPPAIEDPMEFARRREAAPVTYTAYDVELFVALNDEYADRPLRPAPPRYDEASMRDRARRRLLAVHRSIDLADKRVLEFGCGGGFEIWTISHSFGSEGWGIDITARKAWQTLADERTHLIEADIVVDRPYAADFFDRVVSFTVFEHVEHPYASLAELYRVLKPGGLAYIKANLHRGPMASHRYREVTFPFPHLLFTDDVFRAFYRRRGMPELNAAWVNRLTWSQYEDYFARIGFRIRSLHFSETPLDEVFYRRFEGILGRYPRTDLTRDFFEVVLEKPRRQLPSIARRS
jgi:SAM-dependent methyltransferase